MQICVRSLKPFDWLKAMQKAEPVLQEAEFGGTKYLTTRQPAGRGGQLSYYMPDERTLIGSAGSSHSRVDPDRRKGCSPGLG